MRIRQTKNFETIKCLHSELLPGVEFETPENGNVYWLVRDGTGRLAGFCSVRPTSTDPGAVFMSRAGVLPHARKRGLHRRLIRVRLNWARRNGYQQAITYTTPDNIQSAVNLLKCGFMLYAPEYPWAGREMLYFTRNLVPSE